MSLVVSDPRPEHDPVQQRGEYLVDQPQRRQRIMPGPLPRTNAQVTGCVRSSGTHRLAEIQAWTDADGKALSLERLGVLPGSTVRLEQQPVVPESTSARDE